MAITYFRVSKLPDIINIEKNSIPVIVNDPYLLSEQNEIEYINNSGFKGEFLDNMEIEVSEDGNIWSSPAMINIKEFVLVNTPEATNETLSAAKNNVYVPYDLSKININDSTDRIEITGISGYGLFKFKDVPLNIGDEIYMHELQELKAYTFNGAGLPYLSLLFRCGNHIGYNTSEEYQLDIDILSLAEISSQDVYTDTGNPVIETVLIENGLSGKTAALTIVISGTMFSNGPESEITISYDGEEITVTENSTVNINVVLDNDGKAPIEIQHNYSNFTTATSNVELTIDDIDGDPANVGIDKTYTSTVNYI